MSNIDLLDAFISYNASCEMFEGLVNAIKGTDPVVALLALEGLYRIESDVERNQFVVPCYPLDPAEYSGKDYELTGDIRNFLRTWRCKSPLSYWPLVSKIFQSLTIFKTFEVPLFIDDYGEKKPLSSYGNGIENIDINGDTPIYHVTHSKEAKRICDERRFKPSDNKNSIKGCWFGLESPVNSGSVYGNRSFETTLSKLCVTGLHQGEIVAYKNEVNVILYAADDTTFENLKKPTDKAVKESNLHAYVKVSIFVPARFLPTGGKFMKVIANGGKPDEVQHGPFCLRAARLTGKHKACNELNFNQ